MASTTPSDSGGNTVAIEWRGQFSENELHKLVEQLGGNGAIMSFKVEYATDQAGEIPSELLSQLNIEQAEESGQEEPEAAPETEEESEPGTWLQVDATPFKVMRILDANDEWMRTQEIREPIPEEWDVNVNNIGTTLSNLNNRDLVEKRPYEEDKRQTEYRITEAGRDAVKAAHDRAEEQEQEQSAASETADEELVAPESE